jgi:hypothetical protein
MWETRIIWIVLRRNVIVGNWIVLGRKLQGCFEDFHEIFLKKEIREKFCAEGCREGEVAG